MEQTIISISGFGYSGSGAIKDLLLEFDEIDITSSFEFQILYLPDGISDLDYHLNISFSRFYDSDIAINRFLSLCKKLEVDYESTFQGHLYEIAYKYICKITALQWNSYWAYDRLGVPVSHYSVIEKINQKIFYKNSYISIVNRLLRKFGISEFKYLSYKEPFDSRQMYLSLRPKNFLLETKKFINELLSYVRTSKPYIVYDQLLPPNNSAAYFKYFEKIKSIVVIRDPRDTWIFSKLKRISFIPHTNVEDFIIWYDENHKAEAQLSTDGVLYINFESLIYDYENTVIKIMEYIGISNHNRKGTIFMPNISINNTQLYKKYTEYADDINLIEAKLGKFLFDFSKYSIKPTYKSDIF